MRIVVKKQNVVAVLSFRERARILASKKWKTEANRALIDAGRKTKTQVQRAVRDQMALAPGNYQGYVTANTRGVNRPGNLSYEIFGVKGGQRIEIYKGLRVLSAAGKAAASRNLGRAPGDRGVVQSGVWNSPRVFKRSFEGAQGGYFALLPGKVSSRAPRAFWTFGNKPNQPRQQNGRFGQSNQKYGRVRRLAGPSLIKEIPKGASLATFQRVGPVFLEEAVMKRLDKILRF